MRTPSVMFLVGAVGCASAESTSNTSSAVTATCSDAALSAAIVPPSSAAGIDLSANGAWTGITLAAMEQGLCTAHAEYSNDTDDYYSFGRGEVVATVNREAGKIDYVAFNPGYSGAVSFHSAEHTYEIGPGRPVLRDGQPWAVDWRSDDAHAAVNELHAALIATFAPELAVSGDCFTANACVLDAQSNGRGSEDIYLGSRLLHFYTYFEADLDTPAGTVLPSNMLFMYPHKPGT